MSVLYVSEFANMASIGTRHLDVAPMPPIAEQTVSIGVSSTQSSPFSSRTRVIRVCADAECSIKIGDNPTALTASMRIPANVPEYFAVNPGQIIAVVKPYDGQLEWGDKSITWGNSPITWS
jgi:hypothetical protein